MGNLSLSPILCRFSAIALAGLLGFCPTAQARMDVIPGSPYMSARGAALGDAYLPLGDDAPSALFYNPAVAGKFKITNIEPVNAAFYMNAPYFSNLGFNSLSIWSLSAFQPTLAAAPLTKIGAGGQFIPSFYTHFSIFTFALGALLQSEVVGSSDSSGKLSIRSNYQFIPAATLGFRFADGILRLGYSFQWVNEAVGSVVGLPSNSAWSSGLQQGGGFSHNAGISVELPVATLPEIDMVARNIAGTTYNMGSIIPFTANSSGAPPTTPMSFDASFSIHPKFGKGTVLNVVAEIRDFMNSSNTGIFEKLALGTEFIIRDTIFLRGGFGSGYPAAGIGLKYKIHELNLAWFSQELGSDWGQSRDIRFMFQYQLKIW